MIDYYETSPRKIDPDYERPINKKTITQKKSKKA